MYNNGYSVNKVFQGAYTALVTPFYNNEIDFDSLDRLLGIQLNEPNLSGVVVLGTTGESPTITDEERLLLIKHVIERMRGKQVIVGAGSNSTRKACEYTREAKDLGADGVLICTPYYNKPTQPGIIEHFKILNEVGIPIIMYDIPSRAGVRLALDTIIELSEFENIKGIKDSTGDIENPSILFDKIKKTDFSLISGEDDLQAEFNKRGGVGVISVTSNIAPDLISAIQNLSKSLKFQEAIEANNELINLHKAMFIETNPGPVKHALHKMGIIKSSEMRLPLVSPTKDAKLKIDNALMKNRLID